MNDETGIRIKLLKVLTLTLLRELEYAESAHTSAAHEFDLPSEVQRFEAELIRSALVMTDGCQRQAAKVLGMKVTTLHTKVRRYGLTLGAPARDLELTHNATPPSPSSRKQLQTTSPTSAQS